MKLIMTCAKEPVALERGNQRRIFFDMPDMSMESERKGGYGVIGNAPKLRFRYLNSMIR